MALVLSCQGQLEPGSLQRPENTSTATRSPSATPVPTAPIFGQPSDVTPTQAATATATARPSPSPTRTPPSRQTATPVPSPVPPTATATATAVTQPSPTPEPVPTIGAPEPPPAVVYGPVDGRLVHLARGDYGDEFPTGVKVADFIVTATFINPFATLEREWNYGYWFRISESDGFFWTFGFSFPAKVYDGLLLVIKGDSEWLLIRRTVTVADQGRDTVDVLIASGNVPRIFRQYQEENTVSLAAFGDTGWLMVNGDLVAEMDLAADTGWLMVNGEPVTQVGLSAVTGPGDLRAVNGVFIDDEFNLSFTDFKGLTVSEGRRVAAPGSGSEVMRLPTGQDVAIAAGLQGDFVAEMVLQAPTPLFSGPWSWSVGVESGDRRVLLVAGSDRQVTVTVETRSDDEVTSTVIANTVLLGILTQPNAPNRVQVVVIGDTVGFMINGETLPSAQLEAGVERSVALAAYVRDEASTQNRPINASAVEVWQAAVAPGDGA